MIYKNYILDKKLSGLDIYLVFFCLLLVSLLDVFFMLISLLVYFFVNYGGLLMQIVIFVFSIFVFTLIWLVLIRNICYLLKKKRLPDAQYWTVILHWKKQPPEVFYKNTVLKILQYLTGKHLYEIFKNTYFEEHLHTAASELTLCSDCLVFCF